MSRLLAGTLLIPFALMSLGIWEGYRGNDDVRVATLERERLAPVVAALQARQRSAPSGAFDMGLQFQRGGQLYGGPLAVTEAQDQLHGLDTAIWLAHMRDWLPPVVAVGAGMAAVLSGIVLLAAAVLGRAGQTSREALLRGFSAIRRVLPSVMGTQILLMACAFVAAVPFEAGALLDVDDVSVGSIKLLALGVVAALISLWTAGRAVFQLKRTVAVFTPDPQPISGRLVSSEAASGLWLLLHDLGARLGSLHPDDIVIGLTGGFFVSSGLKRLRPSGTLLSGRTLYLPLPALSLLRADEVAAIIAHELAHFSGGDTEWSQRFLPIYAGVERSLHAVATAATGQAGTPSPLVSPSLRLGRFAMDRFHHAVRHWSRLREFAADAAGAAATSIDASARALLRVPAMQPRIDEILALAARTPGDAPADLVASILDHAVAHGLEDPAAHLEDEQPHPTDTHPPTTQRLAALRQKPSPDLLARAASPPDQDGLAQLGRFFAEPAALSRAATTDFLAEMQAQRSAYRDTLQTVADSVAGAERVLHENTRGAVVLNIGATGFALAGLALLVFGLHGLDVFQQRVTGGVAMLVATMLAARASMLTRRAGTPFMRLRAEAMALPGLDRPIAWDDVADLDVTVTRSSIVTRILLPPEASYPARLPGSRRLRLDPERGIITVKAAAPRGMTAQGYATLIGQYRRAALARRRLRGGSVASDA